jgi:hypothetical protein
VGAAVSARFVAHAVTLTRAEAKPAVVPATTAPSRAAAPGRVAAAAPSPASPQGRAAEGSVPPKINNVVNVADVSWDHAAIQRSPTAPPAVAVSMAKGASPSGATPKAHPAAHPSAHAEATRSPRAAAASDSALPSSGL